MTKLLEQAMITVQALPAEMQDEIARMVLTYAGEGPVVALTPEEEADLAESEAAASRRVRHGPAGVGHLGEAWALTVRTQGIPSAEAARGASSLLPTLP